MNPRMRPLALIALLLTAACRNPSPEAVFHTLSPLEALAPVGRSLPLEIMPVQLPELLQRSQVVIADGQGRQRLSSTHRWGNLLEKDMQRVIVEDLSSCLGGGTVVPYPLGERVKAAYRVSLEVQQCEGAPGGSLQLAATWMVTRSNDGALVLLRKTRLQETVGGGGIGDLVSAHDRILGTLCREIATGLAGLGM